MWVNIDWAQYTGHGAKYIVDLIDGTCGCILIPFPSLNAVKASARSELGMN